MSNEDDDFNPLANHQQVEQFDSDLEEEYEEEEVSCPHQFWPLDVCNQLYIDRSLDVIHYSGSGTTRP
jgi:hypothetical protein